jgi:hypothetical protein
VHGGQTFSKHNAEVGLFGRPTLEHNCETLFWIPDVIEKGPEYDSLVVKLRRFRAATNYMHTQTCFDLKHSEVFFPFYYQEAAANLPTNEPLDTLG